MASATQLAGQSRFQKKQVFELFFHIFSSFNDVALSNSMFVDCCMLFCWEFGPIAAVRCRRPPWSIDAKICIRRNRHLPLLFLLFCLHRHHTSLPHDVSDQTTRRHDRSGLEAAELTAPMLARTLFLTRPGRYRQLSGMIPYVFLRKTQPT